MVTVSPVRADWTNKTGRPFNEDGLEIFAVLDADQTIVDNSEDDAVLKAGACVIYQIDAFIISVRC